MVAKDRLIAFLATANAEKAREFYESKLGLERVGEDTFAIVYDVQGIELRIQKLERVTPQPQTVLGWSVTSIEETVRTLAEAGVSFVRYRGLDQHELGFWTSPSGAKVAWFKDPDGNTLSLTEHGT